MVERCPYKAVVLGSNPSTPTKKHEGFVLVFFYSRLLCERNCFSKLCVRCGDGGAAISGIIHDRVASVVVGTARIVSGAWIKCELSRKGWHKT